MGNLALATLETVQIVPLTAVPFFTVNSKQEHAICHAVNAITTLSILNAAVIHIEVEYLPWLNDLSVKVFDADTDYMQSHPRKFGCSVQLNKTDALSKLNQLEDRLIELVGTAKDKLMGAV